MKRSAHEMLSSDGVEAQLTTTSAAAGSAGATAQASSAGSSSSSSSSSSTSSTHPSAVIMWGSSYNTPSSSSTASESSSAAQRRKLENGAGASSAAAAAEGTTATTTSTGCSSRELNNSKSLSVDCAPTFVKEILMDIDAVPLSIPGALGLASAVAKEKQVAQSSAAGGSHTGLKPAEAVQTVVPDSATVEREVKFQLILEELVCDVCLELLVDPAALAPCQHVFCWSCVKAWMQDSNKCPTCATMITQASVSHKLSKLSELAATLLPADRTRPAEELKAARSKLEQHRMIYGSSVVRPTARIYDDGVYREDMMTYWPCLACRPDNRSGYQCPNRIPEPPNHAPPPSRGSPWPMIEDADEEGLENVVHHDSCSGCTAWIPAKAPDHIVTRCYTCTEASCQAFDSEGECPAGFGLYNLGHNRIPFMQQPRTLFDTVPLAGINEIEKELLLRYLNEIDQPLQKIVAGLAGIARRESGAHLARTAWDRADEGAGEGPSASAGASMSSALPTPGPSSAVHRQDTTHGSNAGIDSLDEAQNVLTRQVVRYETTRSAFRLQSGAHRPDPAPGRGTAGGGSASASSSSSSSGAPIMLRNVVPPTRIEGYMAEALMEAAFCQECLRGVIGHFAVWWWMEERAEALKVLNVPDKVHCEKVLGCELQVYRQHADAKNHICEPKPKNLEGASTTGTRPTPPESSSSASAIETSAAAATGEGAATSSSLFTRQLRSRVISHIDA